MTRRSLGHKLTLIAAVCSFSLASVAQRTAAVGASATAYTTGVVPKVVNYWGRLTDLNGKPLTGITGVTFLLYREPQGGAPLWLETQSVQTGKDGKPFTRKDSYFFSPTANRMSVESSYFEAARTPGAMVVAGSAAVLLAAAVVASLLPALRPARVDVVQALRSD